MWSRRSRAAWERLVVAKYPPPNNSIYESSDGVSGMPGRVMDPAGYTPHAVSEVPRSVVNPAKQKVIEDASIAKKQQGPIETTRGKTEPA